MSGFDIGALKTALATKIAAAYTAAGWGCNVYDYAPADPITPCVVIDTGEVEYHQTANPTSGVSALALEIEVRIPAGSARDVDALKDCDKVKGIGDWKSLFTAVSSDNYALTGVTGWAIVLLSSSAPQLVGTVDGQRFWYSVTFPARLARSNT